MSPVPSKLPWPIVLVFLLLTAAMGVVGVWVYVSEQAWLLETSRRAMRNSTTLRSGEIQNWRAERLADGRVLQTNRPFLDLTRALLARETAPDAGARWDDVMALALSRRDYLGAALIDGEGRTRHEVGRERPRAEALQALGGGAVSPFLGDPEAPEGAPARMLLTVPLPAGLAGEGGMAARVVIVVDPTQGLFGLLRGRGASTSSENLLVRRLPDGVAVLASYPAAGLPGRRLSAADGGEVFAHVTRAQPEVFDGPGLRGERAIAAVAPIGDSGWWLVSSVPVRAVLGETRANALRIALLVGLLSAMAGVILLFVWQRRQAGLYRELWEAESRRKALAETIDHLTRFANDIILLADEDGRILEANERAVEAYGYTRDELLSLSLPDLRAPEDRDRFRADYQRIARDGSATYRVEHIRKNGERFPVEARARYVERQGRYYFHGIVQDITDRVAMERQLQETAERYRELFNAASDGIALADVGTGLIVDANRKMAELTGRPVEELRGAHHTTLHPPEDLESSRRNLRGQATGNLGDVLQVFLQHRDGRRVPVEINASMLQLEGRPVMLGIFRDLTERFEATQALTRSEAGYRAASEDLQSSETRRQKLESLALLAGGIAHDFNNLLVGISGNVSLAKQGVAEGTEAHACLDEAERAGQRAVDLTRQLLTFSKGGAPITKVVDLARLMRETASFACSGTRVRCEAAMTDAPLTAEVDEGQIGQVINNIALNGVQAMPDGGTLSMQAERIALPPGNAPRLPAGSYARLRLTDTGVGIEPQLLGRIFDPYFTTKAKGTGLGLAISHSIIRRHGGDIAVTSTPGAGTTFEILLPATDRAPSPAAVPRPEALARGGRVLVMDDEEAVRTLALRMVGHLGFDAEGVSDGEAALDAYDAAARAGRKFDVVIMDLTISGGLGGLETIGRLLKRDPAAVVVVSSGYSIDPVMGSYQDHGFAAVLAKPYRIDQMRRTLAEVLNRPAP